ncbi:hypothetical protein [Sulfurimonas sp.]|uniref:hypothetical protein n=1 Tax=Sulfurimonas sp. TaxID=2022749 RepID=UPI0035645A32
MQAKAIVTDTYLDPAEISEHLKNVDYIIMASDAPKHFKDTPIHFSIFLNTSDNLPKDIQEAILDKFLDEQGISNPTELMSQLMPVGFGKSTQETPMPLLLIRPEDQRTIPHTVMFVMDFLGDSENFNEAKHNALTGWSYSYN